MLSSVLVHVSAAIDRWFVFSLVMVVVVRLRLDTHLCCKCKLDKNHWLVVALHHLCRSTYDNNLACIRSTICETADFEPLNVRASSKTYNRICVSFTFRVLLFYFIFLSNSAFTSQRRPSHSLRVSATCLSVRHATISLLCIRKSKPFVVVSSYHFSFTIIIIDDGAVWLEE